MRVQDPVKAYYYVRDFIVFDPSVPVGHPEITIKTRKANCIGKAILLISIYRALNIPKEHLRVVVGELKTKDDIIEHAWVEVKYQNIWFQQDPTDLISLFDFGQFPWRSYYKSFVRKESYCFNDTGFAIISQRNQFR